MKPWMLICMVVIVGMLLSGCINIVHEPWTSPNWVSVSKGSVGPRGEWEDYFPIEVRIVQ